MKVRSATRDVTWPMTHTPRGPNRSPGATRLLPTTAAPYDRTVTPVTESVHQHERVLDQSPQGLEETSAEGSIDDAMIAAHRDAHAFSRDDLSVDDHRLVLERANREDP